MPVGLVFTVKYKIISCGVGVVKKIVWIAIVLILIVIVRALFEKPVDTQLARVIFPESDLILQVEIAETEKQRENGLMFRSFLPLNQGMLFVFDQDTMQGVWMKNTLIALDVVFLSGKGAIVSIIQDLKPCIKAPCEIYESKEKAKYMLEMNAGVIKKMGVSVGQTFILEMP